MLHSQNTSTQLTHKTVLGVKPNSIGLQEEHDAAPSADRLLSENHDSSDCDILADAANRSTEVYNRFKTPECKTSDTFIINISQVDV